MESAGIRKITSNPPLSRPTRMRLSVKVKLLTDSSGTIRVNGPPLTLSCTPLIVPVRVFKFPKAPHGKQPQDDRATISDACFSLSGTSAVSPSASFQNMPASRPRHVCMCAMTLHTCTCTRAHVLTSVSNEQLQIDVVHIHSSCD